MGDYFVFRSDDDSSGESESNSKPEVGDSEIDEESKGINKYIQDEVVNVDEDSTYWRFVHEKSDLDVKIFVNPNEKLALKSVSEEVDSLLQVLKSEMALKNWTFESGGCFAFFLEPLVEYGLNHINAVASRNNQSAFSKADILNFLKMELVLCYYAHTPTEIFQKRRNFPLANNIISEKKYFDILNALCESKELEIPYKPNRGLAELEKSIAERCRSAFVQGKSVVSLDDDKLAINDRRARMNGIVAKKIKDGFGPVQHTLASVHTGMFLGSKIEMRQDDLRETIEILLKRLCNVESKYHIDLQNTIFSIDRGYNTKVTSEMILGGGGHVIGTRKRETNFPFTFSKSAKANQKRIQDAGHHGTYWAQKVISIEEKGKRNITAGLHAIGMREHSRVTLLETSMNEIGCFGWAYLTKKMKDPIVFRGESDVDGLMSEADSLISEFQDKIYRYTQSQGTRDWFLARKFFLTSNVVSNLVTKWFYSESGIVSFYQSQSRENKRRFFDSMVNIAEVIGCKFPKSFDVHEAKYELNRVEMESSEESDLGENEDSDYERRNNENDEGDSEEGDDEDDDEDDADDDENEESNNSYDEEEENMSHSENEENGSNEYEGEISDEEIELDVKRNRTSHQTVEEREYLIKEALEELKKTKIRKNKKEVRRCLQEKLKKLARLELHELCIHYLVDHLKIKKPNKPSKREKFLEALINAHMNNLEEKVNRFQDEDKGEEYEEDFHDFNAKDRDEDASESELIEACEQNADERERVRGELSKKKKRKLIAICDRFFDDKNRSKKPKLTDDKNKYIEALLNANISLDDINDAETAPKSFDQILHDCWFMAPFEKSHLRIGLENEARIIKWLSGHLLANKIELVRVVTYGLIGLKSEEYAATSIDSLLVVREINDLPNSYGPLQLLIAEFKTRSSRDEINKLNTVVYHNGQTNFWKINVFEDMKMFRTIVPEKKYRSQILHHIAATGLNKVLYVEATQEKIVYSTLLSADANLMDNFRATILRPIQERFIQPIFDFLKKQSSRNNDNSEFFLKFNIEPKFAIDGHTYRQAFFLREKIISQAKMPEGPYLPARAIIPAVVDYWNNQKGGVDVVTRLVDNINPMHAKLNMFGRVYLRTFCTMVMNSHLATRLWNVQNDIFPFKINQKFESYTQFKDRLNSRSTLNDFLDEAITNFDEWMKIREISTPIDSNNSQAIEVESIVQVNNSDPGTGSYYTRNLWNKGEMSSYRKHIRQSNHKSNSEDSGRCIVCCEHCFREASADPADKENAGKTHKYRLGHRTTKCCFPCANFCEDTKSRKSGITRSTNEDVRPIYLCEVRRFKDDPRTCFEIHHSTSDYPVLKCTNHERPRALGKHKGGKRKGGKKERRKKKESRPRPKRRSSEISEGYQQLN